METKTELYRPEEPAVLERKERRWRAAACVIAAGALAACVFFCLRTDAMNAAAMELRAVATFTLAGWVVIYLLTFPAGSARKERLHAQRILAGERETLRGRLALAPGSRAVRGSITVRSLTVTDGEGKVTRVLADAARCAPLERALERGGAEEWELEVVGGYAAAFGKCHADP